MPPVSPQEEYEFEGEGNECDNFTDAVETKPILMPIEMDESDLEALNELISVETLAGENLTTNIDDGGGISENDACEQDDPLSTAIGKQSSSNNNEQVATTEAIDDDLEITYIPGQILLPKVQSTPMVVKGNNELSGRMPYEAILDRRDVSMKNKRCRGVQIQCLLFIFYSQ